MKSLLLILFFITNICLAQQNLQFDSIAIMNGDTTLVKLKCKTTFVYFPQGFVLTSDDTRVYSYLLPGTEFFNFPLLSFRDMGKAISDIKTKKSLVIYETKYKNTQIAQCVSDKGILLMKRNNTGILFY